MRKAFLLVIMSFIFVSANAADCVKKQDAEPTPWQDQSYRIQFLYLEEAYGAEFDQGYWDSVEPEEQAKMLNSACQPALKRLEEVKIETNELMSKWNPAESKTYYQQKSVFPEKIEAAERWLGPKTASRLEENLSLKIRVLERHMSGKLTEEDANIASRVFDASMSKSVKESMIVQKEMSEEKPENKAKKMPADNSKTGKNFKQMNEMANLGPDAGNLHGKFYDGAEGKGDPSVMAGDVKDKGKLVTGEEPAAVVKAKTNYNNTVASIMPPKPPEKDDSVKFMPDSYGITIHVQGQNEPLTFRKGTEAEAVLRKLPSNSVSKITFYGHGSPGLQTVGENYDVDSGLAGVLLKNKMVPNGVVEFAGCNTASIGGHTVNPAMGLSMIARRVLYFSVPYFQDRLNGVPADQARQTWEGTWNKDLAMETSSKLPNSIVCGYRSFGLVPGRLVGRESATPGTVLGKKACYLNGQEVPVPD